MLQERIFAFCSMNLLVLYIDRKKKSWTQQHPSRPTLTEFAKVSKHCEWPHIGKFNLYLSERKWPFIKPAPSPRSRLLSTLAGASFLIRFLFLFLSLSFSRSLDPNSIHARSSHICLKCIRHRHLSIFKQFLVFIFIWFMCCSVRLHSTCRLGTVFQFEIRLPHSIFTQCFHSLYK